MASLQCYKTCEQTCQEKNHHGGYGQQVANLLTGQHGHSNGGYAGQQGYSNGGYSGQHGHSNGGYAGQHGHSNGGYAGQQGYSNGGFTGNNGHSNGGFTGHNNGHSNGGYTGLNGHSNGGHTGHNGHSNGGYIKDEYKSCSKTEVITQSGGHLGTKTHGSFSKTHSGHASGGSNRRTTRKQKSSLFGKIKNGLSGHSSDDNSSCSDSDSGSGSDNEKCARRNAKNRQNYCN